MASSIDPPQASAAISTSAGRRRFPGASNAYRIASANRSGQSESKWQADRSADSIGSRRSSIPVVTPGEFESGGSGKVFQPRQLRGERSIIAPHKSIWQARRAGASLAGAIRHRVGFPFTRFPGAKSVQTSGGLRHRQRLCRPRGSELPRCLTCLRQRGSRVSIGSNSRKASILRKHLSTERGDRDQRSETVVSPKRATFEWFIDRKRCQAESRESNSSSSSSSCSCSCSCSCCAAVIVID